MRNGPITGHVMGEESPVSLSTLGNDQLLLLEGREGKVLIGQSRVVHSQMIV